MIDIFTKNTGSLVLELSASMTDTEKDSLWEDMHSLGLDQWETWYVRQVLCGHVFAFVSAGKDYRAQDPRWLDQTIRHRMTLAGIRYLQGAIFLLKAAENGMKPLDLPDQADNSMEAEGAGSNEIVASIGQIFFAAFHGSPVADWPFEGPTPFEAANSDQNKEGV